MTNLRFGKSPDVEGWFKTGSLDVFVWFDKGGLAHVPTEVTGFGVRYTLSLLLDENILDAEV